MICHDKVHIWWEIYLNPWLVVRFPLFWWQTNTEKKGCDWSSHVRFPPLIGQHEEESVCVLSLSAFMTVLSTHLSINIITGGRITAFKCCKITQSRPRQPRLCIMTHKNFLSTSAWAQCMTQSEQGGMCPVFCLGQIPWNRTRDHEMDWKGS